MKGSSFLLLLRTYLCYVAAFLVAKPLFMLVNAPEGISFIDYLMVLWHGLPLDLATAGYFMIVPLLLLLVACWVRMGKRLFSILFAIYFAITALLISVAICADCVLYGFWSFKLDATVLNYLDSPKDALASVSGWYVVGAVAIIVLVAALLFWALRWSVKPLTKTMEEAPATPSRWLHKLWQTLLLVLAGGVIFLLMRGGVGKSTMNIGRVYYSENQFLNHSAVNPLFNFFYSLSKSQDFAKEYHYFDDEESLRIFADLQINTVGDTTSMQVLRTERPNVVLVLVEGFTAQAIETLGGEAGVTPCFNVLCQEGICFDNCYANSFRTDRGTVSILSGYPAFPSLSVMKMPQKSSALPSLARSLKRGGYSTSFLYGGDINFTNMNSYFLSTGYDEALGEGAFPVAVRTSHAWGVQDHIVLDTFARQIIARSQQTTPFFATCLTLSSHEPWEVPYQRIDNNPKANSLAYTDSCIGVFVNTLKNSAVWDNLLIIFVADHGISYPEGITEDDPTKHHIPLLWIGGAVCDSVHVTDICNQSDLAATLLGAMNLPAGDYHFSRNVLGSGYVYPFAMHSYAGGFAFIDSTGATVYDLNGKRVTTDSPTPSEQRLQRGKAYLQGAIADFMTLGSVPNNK